MAIEDIVRSNYAAVATSGLSTEQAGVRSIAEAFGYSAEELRAAGFDAVAVVDKHLDLTAYAALEGQSGCCTPNPVEIGGDGESCCAPSELLEKLAELCNKYDINDFAASVQVYAIKNGDSL